MSKIYFRSCSMEPVYVTAMVTIGEQDTGISITQVDDGVVRLDFSCPSCGHKNQIILREKDDAEDNQAVDGR